MVCTTLSRCAITAVLTGGSAATFYAPQAHQSRDLDFIIQSGGADEGKHGVDALTELGYRLKDQMYVHARNQLILEFPRGPLSIGDDIVKSWNTIHRGDRVLHVLSAIDCVRDRLLWFYQQPTDRSSLRAAVGVASRQKIELEFIKEWSQREGFADKFQEFERQIKRHGA